MPPPVVELDVSAHQTNVRLFSCPIWDVGLGEASLANVDEVRTFVVDKRRREHLSGRWLLEQVLREFMRVDASLVMVIRDEHRAPSLTYINGVWVRTPLPSISIAHSQGRAFVAVGPADRGIGVDAEPVGRTMASNAFDMMAKGEELTMLRKHPQRAMNAWVAKEAVQKSMGLGMHLNPREIKISIGESQQEISIENSKIQLDIWVENGYLLALATRPRFVTSSTPEERLLDETLLRMSAEPDWGVGCKTQRGSV